MSLEYIQYCRTKKKSDKDLVFLIGGGPSVNTLLPDKSILNNENVITTNNAYKLYPNAIVHLFGDEVWWRWHIDNIIGKEQDFCTASRVMRDLWKERKIHCFELANKETVLSDHPNFLAGNNCGHYAINLAYHIGFTKIVLIGYDMHPIKDCHWHNEHKRPTNVGNFEDVMIPAFNKLGQIQSQYGLTILNANKDSNLKCFEFCELSDYVN